ncbi:MAG: glycosyltransferase family 4 protein [Candidatus Sulfotelmatobacter sp.]|jgi:glycosyltransferase involved in cell wall biosynthesis
MRIAIFTEMYPPHIGGQEVRYAELGEALHALGHEVDVYCIRHSADVPEQENRGGIRIFRYPLSPNYEKPLIKAFRRQLGTVFRYAHWCRRVLRSSSYDLHIFNQWPLLHVMLAPRRARDRAVLDWCEIRRHFPFGLLQRWMPKLVSYNMAVSAGVAEYIARVSVRETDFIPSGIVLSRYRSQPLQLRSNLLYFGRVMEHKNVELLISAFERLAPHGFGGRLVIAGTGPWLDRVQLRATSSPLCERIDVIGFISDERKVELLASSLLLVVPSRREGFPRVVAEAMASGLPVVTVDYPENGTTAVVNRYVIGTVTAPNELASGCLNAIRRWGEFSANGLSASQELDWSCLLGRVLKHGVN